MQPSFIDWSMERVDELFEKYGVIPDPNFVGQNVSEAVRERAERLGTWGKVKRDAQYSGPERARPEALLDAVNVQGNHIRALQSEKERMQRDLANLRLRNGLIIAFVTALATAAAEHFLR